MWQVNYCPNCGARAAVKDRFCGTCGFNLTSAVPQVSPPSYDYLLPYQQWVPAADITYGRGSVDLNKVVRDTGPMASQISKMLEDLFEKRLKYDKT